jgi:hypothetical protein
VMGRNEAPAAPRTRSADRRSVGRRSRLRPGISATDLHQACRCLTWNLESWLSDEDFADQMIPWTDGGYKLLAMRVVLTALLSEAP